MPFATQPLPREWLPKLSKFLTEGFSAAERETADVFSEEMLNWKYFSERGPWEGARSLIASNDGNILSHIGLVLTEIRSTAPDSPSVPALHMIDWLSGPGAGTAGGMLLLQTLKRAPIAYALGCSDAARRVLLGIGFKEVTRVPLYHSILRPANAAVWRDLHGSPPFLRKLALRSLDTLQNLRQRKVKGKLQLRAAATFNSSDESIVHNFPTELLFTSRNPLLLNHLLSHPRGIIKGWRIYEGDAQIGFALTSCLQKPGRRIGKIADIFLSTQDIATWSESISLLREELRKANAHMVSCYANVPWLESALRTTGFFRRGRTPLYIRDPKNCLPLNQPFHITHLEGDAAIL